MKRFAILVLLAASCDHTEGTAEKHLRSMGYKAVACEGRDLATCTADGEHFHCAVANGMGCQADARAACERYTTEKPAP